MIDERMLKALPLAQSLFENHFRLSIDEESDNSQPSLSPRERDCMFWACEGKTAWEMAMILETTERTVNFHLSSAIKKLGVSNR